MLGRFNFEQCARDDTIVIIIMKAAQPRLVKIVAGPNHHDKGSPLVMAVQMLSLCQPSGNRSRALTFVLPMSFAALGALFRGDV
jgi:hypothetical protein